LAENRAVIRSLKPLLAAALLAGVGPVATAAETRPAHAAPWTVRGQVAPADFLIQCHRGAGELAPENTLETFELAWSLGTVPEADLRTTQDGVIVAFHDANFKRVVPHAPAELRDKAVADVPFAELSRLDVGRWKGETFAGQRAPRLSDVYARMRGRPERRLYLDIKAVDLPKAAAEVRAHEVGPQVILASTHHAILREWKRLVPESQTLNWMGGTEEQLRKRLDDLRKSGFEAVTQLQLHVRLNTNAASAEPFNLSRAFIRETGEELRARGILLQSLPWGVAEPAVYRDLLDLGVMSFATDHPKVTLRAVRDYYGESPADRK
jgi:glycerophosphoryl diester phosphodiesterase